MVGIIIGFVISCAGSACMVFAIRQAIRDVAPETKRKNREKNLKKLGF